MGADQGSGCFPGPPQPPQDPPGSPFTDPRRETLRFPSQHLDLRNPHAVQRRRGGNHPIPPHREQSRVCPRSQSHPGRCRTQGHRAGKAKGAKREPFGGRRAELPAPPPATAPQPARVPHTAAEPKAWLCFLWSLSQVLLGCKQVQLIALLWFFSEARIWPLKC